MVRKPLEDTNSVPSAPAAAVPLKVEARSTEDIETISALPDSTNGDFIVCGNNRGSIMLHDLQNGKSKVELYKHTRNCTILCLQWNEYAGIVSTSDFAARLQVVKIVKDSTKGWKKSEVILDECCSDKHAVRQQLLSPDASKLLIATSEWTLLYDLGEKQRVAELETHTQWRPWINHPLQPDLLILFEQSSIRTFYWADLEPALPTTEVRGHEGYDIDYEHYAICPEGGKLYMRLTSSQTSQLASARRIYNISTLDLSDLGKSSTIHFTHYFVDSNNLDIDFIIGTTTSIFNERPILLFFTKSGWICSIDVDEPIPQDKYIRHFFVPSHWLSGTGSVKVRVTGKRDILFVQRDEIAVFRNALDRREHVSVR